MHLTYSPQQSVGLAITCGGIRDKPVSKIVYAFPLLSLLPDQA
jgi:hypothetical protein